ncbi:unnamed protein product [Brachionus calyciflorus]|uniref:Endonuclease/exonuclease/phosphatase domain-containing protein n=1 Tax=Brachionus calyciflorus TaxID=104777 RepID=A0A814HKQ2_9BILA|nr:unnamed protein product [Brachionus calyciflorus]
MEIELIEELLKNNDSKSEIIIIGDLNTDILKVNHNSSSLINLLKNYQLTFADIKQRQETDYTYRKIFGDKVHTSWIDHVICQKSLLSKIDTKILESDQNIGDHNAISILVIDVKNVEHEEPRTKSKKNKINWLNLDQCLMYQKEIEKQMDIEGDITIFLQKIKKDSNKEELKTSITEVINKINRIMINSVKKLKNNLSQHVKRKKKKIGQKKYNRWWDNSIRELHNRVIEAYINYKLSNFGKTEKKILIEAKKYFRRQKRYNLAIKRNPL